MFPRRRSKTQPHPTRQGGGCLRTGFHLCLGGIRTRPGDAIAGGGLILRRELALTRFLARHFVEELKAKQDRQRHGNGNDEITLVGHRTLSAVRGAA